MNYCEAIVIAQTHCKQKGTFAHLLQVPQGGSFSGRGRSFEEIQYTYFAAAIPVPLTGTTSKKPCYPVKCAAISKTEAIVKELNLLSQLSKLNCEQR